MAGWIIYVIMLGGCLLILAGMGLWALIRKTPMHFWSGDVIKPEIISDIKKYNKENAIMWFCYCIPLVISMLIAPFSVDVSAIIVVIGLVGGIPVLFRTYKKIFNKYKK